MPEPERGGRGFAAIALIVLGLLILIPSGLCTGAVAIWAIALSGHASNVTGVVGMALTIGGPFVAVGGVLTWLGFRMRRR
jgi:hypothetical protein